MQDLGVWVPNVELESSAPRGNTYSFVISPVCGLLKLGCFFFFFPLQRPSLRLLPALLLSFFTFCCGDSVHLVFRSLLGRVTLHVFVTLLRPWKEMNRSPEIFLYSMLIFQLLDSHPSFVIIHELMKMGKITVTLWDGGKKQL